MAGADVRKTGIFVLAMINVAAVLGLRNLPAMAVYGWSSVGWYVLGGVCFLIPIGFAGVELATTWQKGGGLYGWVREAFGDSSGFVAIYAEWASIVVWYPAVLAFIGSTLAFAISPDLAANNVFMFATMMTIFWGTTIVALFGERAGNALGTFGVVIGTIIPALIISALGIVYIAGGEPMETPPLTFDALLPDFSFGTIALAGNAILMFAGMEMIGFHAANVRKPQRDLPAAMFISAAVIFVLAVIGTLAVAWVVPEKQLSLSAGLMQAFSLFFDDFGMGWMVIPTALMVALGGIACLQTWLGGPSSGLKVAVDEGFMPEVFAKVNKRKAPSGVLLMQAGIGTVIATAYLLVPGVDTVYWMLSAMTTLLICLMYVMVFASFIKLRYSQPDTPRPFRAPGGKIGVWILGGIGALSCGATLIISLLPPSQTHFGTTGEYIATMLIGFLILLAPPFIMAWLTKGKRAAMAAGRGAGSADGGAGADSGAGASGVAGTLAGTGDAPPEPLPSTGKGEV